MHKKFFLFFVFLCLGQITLYSQSLSQKTDAMLEGNNLQEIEDFAVSYGGWPALLRDYPEMLYNSLNNNMWIQAETFSFLLDRGAHHTDSQSLGGSYFQLSLKLSPGDERYHEIAERLLRPDLDVNWKDEDGQGYLHYICRNDYPFSLRLANQLIIGGVDINAPDSYENTPILLAVSSNQRELTARLLQKHAHLTPDNPKVLYAAAQNNNLEILKMLLEEGMDINSRGWNGETLVINIFANAHMKPIKETLTFLMNNKADPNIADNSGNTVLHWAVRNPDGRHLVPELMKYQPDVNAANIKGERPIHHANSSNMAALLLQFGADPNLRTNEGMTPLQNILLYNRDIELLQTLINGGANVNDLDGNGEPYLFGATGNAEQTRLLLENGANPQQISSGGRTILFPYAVSGSPDVWKLFPIAESYINSKDNNGLTPLHLAFKYRNYDFALDLILRGADYLSEENINGQRPVDIPLGAKHILFDMQVEAPELHLLLLSSNDFGPEYQSKIDSVLQEDQKKKKEQKAERFFNKFLTLSLLLLWLALSFLARKKGAEDVLGTINGLLFMVTVCSAVTGLIFAALTPESGNAGSMFELNKAVGFVFGTIMGAIGGFIGGIVLRRQFIDKPWLYYAAPTLGTLGGLYYVVFL